MPGFCFDYFASYLMTYLSEDYMLVVLLDLTDGSYGTVVEPMDYSNYCMDVVLVELLVDITCDHSGN